MSAITSSPPRTSALPIVKEEIKGINHTHTHTQREREREMKYKNTIV